MEFCSIDSTLIQEHSKNRGRYGQKKGNFGVEELYFCFEAG